MHEGLKKWVGKGVFYKLAPALLLPIVGQAVPLMQMSTLCIFNSSNRVIYWHILNQISFLYVREHDFEIQMNSVSPLSECTEVVQNTCSLGIS